MIEYFKLASEEKQIKKVKNEASRLFQLEEWAVFNKGYIKKLEAFQKRANVFFDDKSIPKTLLNAIDQHLINFLQKVAIGKFSINTLRKWQGTKSKLKNFIFSRYMCLDMPLTDIEFKFASQFYDRLITKDGCAIYLIPYLFCQQLYILCLNQSTLNPNTYPKADYLALE